MSSVSRFTRQVPVSTTYYSTTGLTNATAYEFVPSASNSLGNYPPGTVQTFTEAEITLPSLTGYLLRDMGKTIYAAKSDGSAAGYYRQVQLMTTVSGVLSAPAALDSNTDYCTFYIAVPMAGILGGAMAGVTAIAGGQM